MRALGVGVVLWCAACGGGGGGGDAGVRDAAGGGGDGGPDAMASVADAGPPPDAVTGPLESTLGDPPYLTGDPAGTDVRAAVRGGQRPYTCIIYEGAAPGTVPAGVVQDPAEPGGCVLAGGVDEELGDLPGAYGLIVIVTDAAGDSVEIPVAYEGAPCGAAPDAWPIALHGAGAAATWTITIDDLDGVVGAMGCEPCMSMSALTRAPLAVAPNLACAAGGDLCSDCDGCIAVTGTCPGPDIATAVRDVELRAHAPVRAGVAGWVTVELSVSYSGGSLDPCGSKRWRCHIEALELP